MLTSQHEMNTDCRRDTQRGLADAAWFFLIVLMLLVVPPAQASDFKPTTWADLVPKDWDPMKPMRERNLGNVKEGSEAEMDLMREMRDIWDNAPTRKELDGNKVRLPGYVVPLDSLAGGKTSQFLLVPYFGACVHSPPPPANQIVHVTLKSPAAWRTMDTVWVNGVLSTKRQKSDMGMSGYALSADKVEPYRAGDK